MKGMRIVVALWTLALAACGSGGIQSPDFTSLLAGLEIRDSQNQVVPASGVSTPTGQDVQLKAVGTYTNPPGAATATTKTAVEAEWSSDEPAIATVEPRSGVVTPVAAGTTKINAKVGDRTASVTFIVTGPPPGGGDIIGLAITRVGGTAPLSTDSIPKGGQRSYTAFAVFRDPLKQPSPVAVNWTTSNATIVAAQVPPNNPSVTKPFAIPNEAVVGQVATITATLPISPALGTTQPFAATVDITVSNASFASLDAVILNPASPLVVGTPSQAKATASFIENGATETGVEIPNFNLFWESSLVTVATINGTGTIATLAPGTTNIKATLLNGVFPSVTNVNQRSAFTPLTVTAAGGGGPVLPGQGVCATAFLAPTATATALAPDPLCLLCSATSVDRIIDAIDGNFATIDIPVGLLGIGGVGGQSIQVSSPTVYQPPKRAAFVVGFPVSDILTLELLSQFEVRTFNGTTLQETATVANNMLTLELIGNALLPSIASAQQAIVGLNTTLPFTSLKFTYNSGVATALSSLQVFNACADVPADLLGSGGLPIPAIPGVPAVPGVPAIPTLPIPGLSTIPVLGDLFNQLLNGGISGGGVIQI